MRLIIHAGIHRTGTTSLQHFLASNRTELALQGFAYPFDGSNHQKLAWALHRRKMRGGDLVARLDPLSRSRAHTILLSAEDFSLHQKLDWLEEVSREFEVEGVFYLRRQDDWVMSWYNQHVKWPFDRNKSTLSPSEFLSTIDEFYWLDYERLLEPWVNALGADAIIVGVVERQQVTDVVAHFSKSVGLDTTSMTLSGERRNDSLPTHMLEIARNLRLFELKPKERLILNDVLRTALDDKATGATTVYSPAERNLIMARFAKSNRAVARRFFGRDDLFMMPMPGPEEPYFSFPAINQEELLREWVAPVIRELITRAENVG